MVKHNGGKADVHAIGDRNVGCKTGLGNWYGVEKQVALRKQYARLLEATVKLIQNPMITEYVNRVGQNIVHNSGLAGSVHNLLVLNLLVLNCFRRSLPIQRYDSHVPRDIRFLRQIAFLAIAGLVEECSFQGNRPGLCD